MRQAIALIPKVVAVSTLGFMFTFARVEMANAYYANLDAGSHEATLATADTGQVLSPSSLAPQTGPDMNSNKGTKNDKSKGTGSKSKKGGSNSGTKSASKNKNASGTNSVKGSPSGTHSASDHATAPARSEERRVGKGGIPRL